MKKADLIIILNLPRHVLMKRVFNRYIKNKLDKKGDRFIKLLNLLKFSYLYKKNTFFTHKEMVEKHKKECIILKSDKEIDEFVEEMARIKKKE